MIDLLLRVMVKSGRDRLHARFCHTERTSFVMRVTDEPPRM